MKKFQSVDYSKIDIKNGFWHEKQELNRNTTVYAVHNRFVDTGRFDAFRMDWREGMPNKPHIFWDSDVVKLLEGIAYILKKHPNQELEEIMESTIDLIEKHQGDDGYFNIYFTAVEPSQRFTGRGRHELYCAGHLFEAAVAYFEATGRDRFLKVACRYADYIYKVFVEEDSAVFATPGHQEIELALIRLYRCTNNEKYLKLSKHFIDTRGNNEKDPAAIRRYANTEDIFGWQCYSQCHQPVRQMTEAVGHSVRACYMYSGMADLAFETEDAELLSACKALFKNIVDRRMYITGGIGSTRLGEAFTTDYDLPNGSAYTETCAAISLAMFAGRMLKMEADSLYADTIERVLYNGFLSGLSLDGEHFFYENPLEINLARNNRLATGIKDEKHQEVVPITQRVKVFTCSCCPPNVVRFVSSIANYLYTYNQNTVYVHQFMDSVADFEGITLTQTTNYPADGVIGLQITGAKGKTVGVRIPGWCKGFTLTQNGQPAAYTLEQGYAMVPCSTDEVQLCLTLDMTPQFYTSNPAVWDNAGKIALGRGPVVYCLEGVDHDAPLWALYADPTAPVTLETDPAYPVPALRVDGYCRNQADGALYSTYACDLKPTQLRFVPYYTFANRGESDMTVWVNYKTGK